MTQFAMAVSEDFVSLRNLSSGRTLIQSVEEVPVRILHSLNRLSSRRGIAHSTLVDIPSSSELFGWFANSRQHTSEMV